MNTPILSDRDLIFLNTAFNLRINHIGVQNEFITKRANQGNYIININSGGMGHWVALNIKGDEATYFDSYGIPPPPQVIKFIKSNKLKMTWNINDIQDYAGIECGFYCVAFIHYMNTHTHGDVRDFTALFKNDTRSNHTILRAYLKRYMPLK